MNILKQIHTQLLTILSFTIGLASISFGQNCEIEASATQYEIYCGQEVTLSVYSKGADSVLLAEDFNNSAMGPGWSSTPGGTEWGNPCAPGGVDGTPSAWMGDATNQPRDIISAGYDLTTATAGVTICFDMMYAEQGGLGSCEGPDLVAEGVHIQYSTDGGASWIDINYWTPLDGGHNPQQITWNNYCVTIPSGAFTSNTMFRWHQAAGSGAGNDHWGIDNPTIVINDPGSETAWGAPGDAYYHAYPTGSHGGVNPNTVSPTETTTYVVSVVTGDGDVCTDSVTIVVLDPIYNVIFDQNPLSLCPGETCVDISGVALQMFFPVYEDKDSYPVNVNPGPLPTIIPGNIKGTALDSVSNLDITNIEDGSIQSVCIDSISLPTTGSCSNLDLSNTELFLECPDGTKINLANVGDFSGTSINNICFETGEAPLSSGSGTYSSSFNPAEPFSDLNGCAANGMWKLVLKGNHNSTCNLDGLIHGWKITFSYADTVYDHSWDPTTNLSDPNNINTTVCPTSSPTNYVLTISNGLAGCASGESDTLKVIVLTESPSIDAINITDPSCHDDCDGTINVEVSGGTTPYTYQWFDGNNNPVGTDNDSIDGLCGGDYSVIILGAGGCTGSGDTTLINPDVRDPSFYLSNFCERSENEADSIKSEGGVFSFNPDPNDGATIDPTTGEITDGIGGSVYTVEYLTENGCSSSTENVVVYHTPTVDLSADPTYGKPPMVVDFDNLSSGADNYYWDFGDGSSDPTNDSLLSHVFTDVGVYETILTGETTDGCTDTAHVQIVIVFPDMIYTFPNVFTPNGDGENDMYKLIDPENIAELKVIILNRWGNLVFESNKINFNWNGQVKNSGADCDDGTYFYKATLKGLDGKEKAEHGFIHLNRN